MIAGAAIGGIIGVMVFMHPWLLPFFLILAFAVIEADRKKKNDANH